MASAMVSGPCWELDGKGVLVLFEHLDESIAFVDGDGRLLLTNRWQELPAEPPPVHLSDLGEVLRIFRPDGRPYETGEWPVLRTIRTGEAVIDEEFFRLGPDGARRYFSVRSVPVYAADGRLSGAVVVARDVTEQKHRREQLAYLLPLLDHTEDAIVANDAGWRVTAWNKGAERMYGWTAEEAVRRPATFLQLDESGEQRLERRRQLSERGRWRGEVTVGRKDGSNISVEVTAVAIRDAHGQVTGYLGIHRDTSGRLRAAAQLKTAARELALLADLSMRALRTDDLKTLLDDAVGLVADVLGVDLSSIAEVEPSGQGLGWRSAFGWRREEIIHAPPSPAGPGSLVGYTMAVGQPVVSEDVRADKRFDVSAVCVERAPVSAAAVVIPGPHTPFGVLVAAARTRRSFEPEEIKFMQAVANVIGNAYEHAAAGKRLEAARETERSRIARELHDDGLRELTEALGAATIARSTATGRQDEQRWSSVTVALQRLGRQLRGAIYDLRLGIDDERAFADLLTELVAVQADLTANCQIQLDGQERLPAGSLGHRGVEVVRILREAVTNARRHSGATTIRVSGGASTPGFLRLEVSDDGEWPARGAEVADRRSPGLGSMFERAAEAGALLRIGQRPAGGTIVSLELPLRSESGSGPDARRR